MANIFNSIPARAPKLNAFNLSHDVKLTCEMGQLIPIMCEPVLPSDRFKVSSEHLVRFAPLQSPIMSNIDVYVHYFFVPNRIIWSDWETFITGSSKGKKLADEEVPQPPFLLIDRHFINFNLTSTQSKNLGYGSWAYVNSPNDDSVEPNNERPALMNGNLADYLGFQTHSRNELVDLVKTAPGSSPKYPLDCLPFRAYQRVWFDYYRDENLSTVDDFEELIGGDFSGNTYISNSSQFIDFGGLLSLRQRAWRKDYFTSALPWAQKGDDVLIPGSVDGSSVQISGDSYTFKFPVSSVYNKPRVMSPVNGIGANDIVQVNASRIPSTASLASVYAGSNNSNTLYADLSGLYTQGNSADIAAHLSLSGLSASEATIRELRRAFAAQAFLERRAVGGTRYNEQIMAFFGVKTSDGRLQRAEFLGGSKQPVVISQVLQTSESTADSPLAEPAGTAVSAGGKFIFDRQFEEYGYIIGIMSVMPRADYMYGIPRKYQKYDVYDYYWPQFARIGEQDIYNSELYFNWDYSASTGDSNPATFGYSPRYSEYRFCNNRIHGDFRSSLNYWHLARQFSDTPHLNERFITCRPSNRIFAYEDSDFNHLWVDIHLNVRALRPIPKYAESF